MGKRMNKRIMGICLILILLGGIFLIKNNSAKNKLPYAEQQNLVNKNKESNKRAEDDEELEEALEDPETVIWTVPGIGILNLNNVRYLNELLEKDGHSLKLAVRAIDTTCETEAYAYNKEIEQLLKNGKTDIVYTGMSIEGKQVALPLIEKGYLENLNSLLNTATGKQLKKAFLEEEWEGAVLNGKNYVIPAQDLENQFYVAFNKKYVTKEEAEKFSGNWEDLLNYLSPKMLEEKAFVPLIWNMENIDALQAQGYQEIYGLMGNIETGKLLNPFELSEYHDLLKFLSEAWKKGYMGTDYSFEDGTIGDEAVEAKQKGNYVVLAGCLESYIFENREKLIIVPVKNCKYKLDDDGCTGISAKSTKKEKAFELLTLIYTNEIYANALAYGKEGRDYEVKDGYVHEFEKEYASLVPFVYGMYDLVLQTEGMEFAPNVKQNKRSYLRSDYCQQSIFSGFHLNIADWIQQIDKAKNLYQEDYTVCTAKNFEEKYTQAEIKMSKKTKKLQKYIQEEFDKWYQNSTK